jgi:hypothetical protein
MNTEYLNGRWLYRKLRFCPHLKITTKVYSDWSRTNDTLTGLVCHVNSNLGKSEKLEIIKKFIADNQLPLTVEDEPEHLTRFKIVIDKDFKIPEN